MFQPTGDIVFCAGEITKSQNYVQIVDCSVALYTLLQTYAVCPDPSKKDSGPFCTDYHIKLAGLDDSGTIDSAAAAQAFPLSSLYFFLPNTMQEFPFAWWHKCVLLHSRGLEASEAVVHCTQWDQESISEKDMVQQHGLYNDEDLVGILKRINGGVTSDVLKGSVETLTQKLIQALGSFSIGGFKGQLLQCMCVKRNLSFLLTM